MARITDTRREVPRPDPATNERPSTVYPPFRAFRRNFLDLADAYFEGRLDSNGEIVGFVSDTELVLSDNVLSIIEVGESEIGAMDEDPSEASWYRVPTDGSADPTEIGPVTVNGETVLSFVPISWT